MLKRRRNRADNLVHDPGCLAREARSRPPLQFSLGVVRHTVMVVIPNPASDHLLWTERDVALSCASIPAATLEDRPRVTLAVAIALCIVWNLSPNDSNDTRGNPGDATQANLLTTLGGGGMFYSANNHNFEGITGGPQLPAGVSSIAEIDIGLTYVAGDQASTGPNVISIVAPRRSILVMTAYSQRTRTCWGILRVVRTRASPFFPAYPSTASMGTFYFRGTSSASADCMAATVMPTALNTTGFPAA